MCEILPTDDFYSYVNNKWLNDNNIPKTASRIDIFSERTQSNLNDILEKLDLKEKSKHVDNRLRILWDQFNEKLLTQQDFNNCTFFNRHVEEINNIITPDEFIHKLLKFSMMGVDALFITKKDKNMCCKIYKHSYPLLPEYFLLEQFSDQLNCYKLFLLEMVSYINNKHFSNKLDSCYIATRIYEMEKKLFAHTDFGTVCEHNQINFGFKFNKIFSFHKIGRECSKKLIGKKYFDGLNTIVSNKSNLTTLKFYLMIKLFSVYGVYDNDIRHIMFKFYGKSLNGQKEMIQIREKFLFDVSTIFRSDVNSLTNKIPNESEKYNTALNIFNKIVHICKTCFCTKEWLSENDKQKLLEIFNSMKLEFESNEQCNLTPLKISKTNNFLVNIKNINTFVYFEKSNPESKYNNQFVKQYTKSAIMNLQNNVVVLSSFFLHDEFLGNNIAKQFGSIGVIIAHEIGHIIDYTLKKQDKINQHYINEINKLKLQYNDYYYNEIKFNGAKLLNENVAEYFGWMLAIETLKTLTTDENDYKLFFETYAKMRCVNHTKESENNTIITDVHSFDVFRINGTIQHIPEFYQIYGVKINDPMYLKENLRLNL